MDSNFEMSNAVTPLEDNSKEDLINYFAEKTFRTYVRQFDSLLMPTLREASRAVINTLLSQKNPLSIAEIKNQEQNVIREINERFWKLREPQMRKLYT